MCAKQVKLVQSYLAMARADLDALIEKHKEPAQKIIDLDEVLRIAQAVLILLANDMKQLERHQQIMLETQSPLNLDAWMHND